MIIMIRSKYELKKVEPKNKLLNMGIQIGINIGEDFVPYIELFIGEKWSC